jgi:hypothetical protein
MLLASDIEMLPYAVFIGILTLEAKQSLFIPLAHFIMIVEVTESNIYRMNQNTN